MSLPRCIVGLFQRAARSLIPAVVFAAAGTAQRVWVVAPVMGAGVDFTVIQSAVDAAADGDTILVRTGTYTTVDLRAKALVLVGENATLIPPFGTVVAMMIADLRADQSVVVRGFTAMSQVMALGVSNCAGPVLVDSCGFAVFAPFSSLPAVVGVTGSGRVAFARCSLLGGSLSRYSVSGLALTGSTATLHGCTVRGGTGPSLGAAGAAAATALASMLIASGSTFLGGAGAAGGNAGAFCIPPGNGGDALFLHSNANAVLLDCALVPGAPGAPGTGCPPGLPGNPVGGTGVATFLAGPAASLTTNSPVRTGQVLTLTVGGPPGSGAWLLLSARHDPIYVPACNGTLHTDLGGAVVLFLGFLPASGQLQLQVPVPVTLGVPAATLIGQAGLTQPNGCYLGTAAALVLLDARY